MIYRFWLFYGDNGNQTERFSLSEALNAPVDFSFVWARAAINWCLEHCPSAFVLARTYIDNEIVWDDDFVFEGVHPDLDGKNTKDIEDGIKAGRADLKTLMKTHGDAMCEISKRMAMREVAKRSWDLYIPDDADAIAFRLAFGNEYSHKIVEDGHV